MVLTCDPSFSWCVLYVSGLHAAQGQHPDENEIDAIDRRLHRAVKAEWKVWSSDAEQNQAATDSEQHLGRFISAVVGVVRRRWSGASTAGGLDFWVITVLITCDSNAVLAESNWKSATWMSACEDANLILAGSCSRLILGHVAFKCMTFVTMHIRSATHYTCDQARTNDLPAASLHKLLYPRDKELA